MDEVLGTGENMGTGSEGESKDRYVQYVKYPRTMHLPWSPNLQNDDRRIETLDYLQDEIVVVTEKMDGENTTLYNDHFHARSINSGKHPSRAKIKELHDSLRWHIHPDIRICGENLFARHSITYKDLVSYFQVFGIWQEEFCLDWDTTVALCDDLSLSTVPILYRGPWDIDVLHQIEADLDTDNHEGYVVRKEGQFHIENYDKVCAKWVRAKHVRSDEHWMYQEVCPNTLRTQHQS